MLSLRAWNRPRPYAILELLDPSMQMEKAEPMRRFVLAMVLGGAFGVVSCASTPEPSVVASMHLVSAAGQGEAIGEIGFSPAAEGATVHVQLRGLPPGNRGMHVHTNGSCAASVNAAGETVVAGAAGGHFDPVSSGRHEGPHGSGHLGDLPILQVDANGAASGALSAPRVQDLAALRGKAIIIHAGGDNFSDTPAPLGGGGARIACGVLG